MRSRLCRTAASRRRASEQESPLKSQVVISCPQHSTGPQVIAWSSPPLGNWIKTEPLHDSYMHLNTSPCKNSAHPCAFPICVPIQRNSANPAIFFPCARVIGDLPKELRGTI